MRYALRKGRAVTNIFFERILIVVLAGIIVFLSCRLIDARHEFMRQRIGRPVLEEETRPDFYHQHQGPVALR